MFLKDNAKAWTELILGHGQVAGCCERGNEPSCSIKSGEFVGS